jgi:MFS family permease
MKKSSNLANVFRALSYRNYRLFFSGQILSLIGTWMQNIAMSWMVYRLTGSAFLLGFVSFLNQAPSIFLTPFGGVIADRFDRRKLLLFTQIASMVQAVILAVLALTSTANVWNISILSFFLGLVNAIDAPVRQAFVVQLVDDKKDLSNAIALNSAMFNAARLIGPAIAGLAIAAAGEGICFAANGVSYIAVILALIAIRAGHSHLRSKVKSPKVLAHLKEGVVYSWRSIPIRYLIVMMALVSFLGMSYIVMMPIIAKDVLHGGSHTQGFLMSCAGLGALSGAIYLASRKTVVGLLRKIPYAVLMMGAGIAGLSFSRSFPLSSALLFFVGLGMVIFMGACNTIIQTIVDEDKRGRVMSLYTLAFMGLTPFGSLLVGLLSGSFGISITLQLNGFCLAAGGLFFAVRLPAVRKAIRPVYERMGIIPKQEDRG